MLRIIEANENPVTYHVDKNATFNPGNIAMLKLTKDCLVATVSDGLYPIGVIDDIKNDEIDTTEVSGRIVIWNKKFTGAIDCFEKDQAYRSGDKLYVSPNSELTTKKYTNFSPCVGEVVSLVSTNCLEFIWYGDKS